MGLVYSPLLIGQEDRSCQLDILPPQKPIGKRLASGHVYATAGRESLRVWHLCRSRLRRNLSTIRFEMGDLLIGEFEVC